MVGFSYKFSYTISKIFRFDLSLHWRLNGIGKRERDPWRRTNRYIVSMPGDHAIDLVERK
jgi:hypothetical protein